MRRRLLLLLGLALCGSVPASAPPALELTAAAAWKGWTRPGRSTEVEIRIGSSAPTAATLDVGAGRRTAQASLELLPGRAQRLHVAVDAAERVVIDVAAAGAAPLRRELALSRSESPLLGVALSAGGAASLPGFHTVALSADDLPRQAAAYSSIDALLIDASTLAALDARQLGALLARAAACDRIVVLDAQRVARQLLDSAIGCDGKALPNAASLPEALAALEASLGTSAPRPMGLASLGELAPPELLTWQRVAVGLGVYFALAALLLVFGARLWAWTLLPALFSLAALGLPLLAAAPTQLWVWSEGSSGAPLARYQAWQRFAGAARERVRMPLAPQLAAGAQPCQTSQAMRFELDARSGQATAVEFDTRLFRQVWLCYAGSFPMARAFALSDQGDGQRELRNSGSAAWPPGTLLAGGQSQPLPPLEPGAAVVLPPASASPAADAASRLAAARIPGGSAAALWALDLRGVAGIPADAQGWLLVTAAAP